MKNKLSKEELAKRVAVWRDRESYPTVASVAAALGVGVPWVYCLVKLARKEGIPCHGRADTSVTAAKWFAAGAGKGVLS